MYGSHVLKCDKHVIARPDHESSRGSLNDADRAVAVARAYNDWLHHYFLRVSTPFQGESLCCRCKIRRKPPKNWSVACGTCWVWPAAGLWGS